MVDFSAVLVSDTVVVVLPAVVVDSWMVVGSSAVGGSSRLRLLTEKGCFDLWIPSE